MDVIIPLGGLGNRFQISGYTRPKPLINVMGQPILYWLINSLDFKKINNIIIPYNKELCNYRFEDQLIKDFPDFSFKFKILNNTGGAVETIFESLKDLNYDSPALCIDGDAFFLENIIDKWEGENCVYVFESNYEEPIYSYSLIENNHVIDIKEKEKISNWASAGIYGFESSKLLKNYCEKIIQNNINVKNEFYVSILIKEMLKDGYSFKSNKINNKNFICLGTPMHIREFCSNYPEIKDNLHGIVKPGRYCFDLDNTLVTYPRIKNDYTSVLPITKNINLLKYLKNLGNEIIIYTARRMKTHKGNVGKITADIGRVTIETLEKFNIPYDELYFGKPQADFYIDDLGSSAFNNLEKELGFYNSVVISRDFNTVFSDDKDTVKKISKNDLSGEIFYYKNIPNNVSDLFPAILKNSEDNKFYEIEKISGVPLSKIYLSEELTTTHLNHLINSIKKLHNSVYEDTQNIDIYENYSKKLTDRYNSFDYSLFDNSKNLFEEIKEKLILYEKENCGKKSVIHGDPVFTNVIINQFNKIKFIDMRGKVGNTLTILGDSMYDWSKIYQSLIGYDEILEDIQINLSYKNNLIKSFEQTFLEFYSLKDLENMKLITKSLLFSLIPLHKNEKCFRYYSLINNI